MINRPYNEYFNNPNKEVMEEIKIKIFENMYGDKTERALHFLARAVAGNCEDKNWATYVGNRNCGKGVQYDILENGFGSYIKTFELGNILYNRQTAGLENVDCSRKMYWLLDLEFSRLAISQEIPDHSLGLKCNSKMLKKIAGGGDTIVGKRNYDRVDTHFKIDTTFYIMGNNSLQLDNEDCKEQLIEFNSVNQFKTKEEIDLMRLNGIEETEIKRYKIKDTNIKNKCQTIEWKNAIVYLLFENYKNIPVAVEKEINEDDDSLLGKIKELIEITNNSEDFYPCETIHKLLSAFDKQKIKNELVAMNVFKKQSNTKQYRKQMCYYGIKIIEKITEE
jgi:hypothetical protein